MQTYTLLVQFGGGPHMLQWGVGTSLKCDWRAAEAVETDAVEAMPPGLALKWSGPLYTFQSHETFMVVHLSPSSIQQLGGGNFLKIYTWWHHSYLKFSSYQNHHKPMVWLFPTTPAIEGLCCLCLSHAVPFPFAWLAPILPLDLTLRLTSIDRSSQTNYHKCVYYLLLVPASFSLSQANWICVHVSYYLIHLLDCNVQ